MNLGAIHYPWCVYIIEVIGYPTNETVPMAIGQG